jgi:acyl-CoA synthetase (AMP-forming)/AMP-acid ligase II
VKSNLAGYKVPREIVFIDELPRNATGKVMKKELVEKYEEDADQESSSEKKAGSKS